MNLALLGLARLGLRCSPAAMRDSFLEALPRTLASMDNQQVAGGNKLAARCCYFFVFDIFTNRICGHYPDYIMAERRLLVHCYSLLTKQLNR